VSKVSELVKTTNDNPGEYHEISLGTVPNIQAQKINMDTKVRINGATKILSSFGISHALDSHGEGTGQEKRGQKTIDENDFEFVRTILENPDSVIYGGQNSHKKHCLLYKKIIGKCNYHLVMSVSSKKNRDTGKDDIKMFMNTLYAKNK
jgi:hypothetical protein